MGLQSFVRRRPSASIVVSCIALFVALGGVGWAAIQLPPNSVGTSQLQNSSVTNWKIANGVVGNWKLKWGAVGPRKMMNGAVGLQQINSSQVQARVSEGCSSGAVAAISSSGAVSCVSTPPREFGTSSSSVTLGSGATPIAAKALPGGSSYLVLANPQATITSTVAGQHIVVDCTLAVSPSNGATETRSLIVGRGSTAGSLVGAIPLVVPAPPVATGSTASVSCSEAHTSGAKPQVKVATTINAIQTASNG